MTRVVITGIGAILPLGTGKTAVWDGIRRGKSVVRRIDRFDASTLHSQIAAHVEGFDALDYMDTKAARRLDRFSQFAVACAGMAMQDASLLIDPSDGIGTGVYIGSALGGVGHAENEHTRLVQEGFSAVNRLIALSVFTGAAASNVSIAYGLKGPALSNANSCASGTISVGEAYRLIQHGHVDAMLAGGAEAPLSPLCFGAFDLIGAMSTRNDSPETASRPFDKDRDGFVMAEGGAIFVLESLEHAERRGARIYAEVLGYGVTSDAHHMTMPRPDGAQASRAIQLAMREAKVTPAELDYVNAHGSSTLLNDSTETLAIKQALGESAYKVPISATKAMHGHALGASGAMELAIGLLASDHSYVPPTVNLQQPQDLCDLDYVANEGRKRAIHTWLTHSFGFGGANAALVLRRLAH